MRTAIHDVLQSRPEVAYALLFGSHARGATHGRSDVDVAVGLSRPLSVMERGRLIRALESAVGADVDLVVLDGAPIPLAHRVFKEGALLLCRDREAFVDRKARAIIDYLDFSPIEQLCVEGVIRRHRGR